MSYGYTGKILKVDLSSNIFTIDEHDDVFYRKYLGGPGIGAYYALKEIEPGINPLAPENVLVFAAGTLTGAPGPAIPRYTVCAKSPLTGGIGKAEAGGWWGPELKAAGFDAVVIKGKARHPVYLQITDGKFQLRDARHLWGKRTDECQSLIRDEIGSRVRIAQIGPGGENQVLFANIVNELTHFNGRNGLGAVMGSKNLKAIAVSGSGKVKCFDEEIVKKTTRWVASNMKEHPQAWGLHNLGTPGGITVVNAGGSLPTRNWQENTFERAMDIGAEKLEEILIKRGGCYSCPIRCKRVVKVDREDLQVDPALGGPEYETLVCLGSNLGIGNIELICKANEICNKLTLDTITMGMTISFAMECFEKGLITTEDTGGFELRFGNEEVLLPLIELTALKKGFGEKLALGSVRLAKQIGRGSEEFLLHTKNQEVPAHDPRVKTGVGLQYALSSHGADHWVAQHDPFYQEKGSAGLKSLESLGIYDPVAATDLSAEKVRLYYYTHLLTIMYDCLGICVFGYVSRSIVPLEKMIEMTSAVTGWNTSLWALLKAGERASVMLRMFNLREGFSSRDDSLPKKLRQPISTGPLSQGNEIDEQKFTDAVKLYYQMAGWDADGKPLPGKLYELDLGWVLN